MNEQTEKELLEAIARVARLEYQIKRALFYISIDEINDAEDTLEDAVGMSMNEFWRLRNVEG
jgi:uncharacterized protein YqgV (UPF0045/DUF77 family)